MGFTKFLLVVTGLLCLVAFLVVGDHYLLQMKMERMLNDDIFINRIVERVKASTPQPEVSKIEVKPNLVETPKRGEFEGWSQAWETQRDQ